MSEAAVTIRYDGPILANHQMDIADLAPALLGISELCKIANKKFNGERAAVKVLIGTDAEHKCFQLNLHVVQTLWEHTKSIIHSEDVKTAKEVLEWLGLLGGPTLGFFQLLRKLKEKKITTTVLESKDGRDVIRITITGDNNEVVFVHPQAMELIRDETAVTNAKKVVQPLIQEGYSTVEFESDSVVLEKIDRDDAAAIISVYPSEIEKPEIDEPQTITVWITVYSPVYDPKAPNWRFKFGDAHEYIDITDTDIAQQAIRRGGAMVDDAYRVELEIRQEHKIGGGIKNHYKIVKVLDFKPARLPYQADAFSDPTDDVDLDRELQ